MECGAKKRNGEPCRTQAMPNGKCRIHGGKSLAGIASPSLKTGRYSKNLPTRFMVRYQESLSDPDILALRDDVALLDSRLEDLLAKVDTGETGETWKALMDAVHEFQQAEREATYGSEAKRIEAKQNREQAIETIVGLCQEGMADYAAWNEVKSVLEARRRVVETETKRTLAMQKIITEDRAQLMQGAWLDIIKRNVTDRATLAAISRDFGSLVLAGDGGRSQP